MRFVSAEQAPIPATMSWRELCRQPEVFRLELDRLSPAEQVVAAHVNQGLSNKEIAHTLGKSEFTVKHQVSSILHKLGVPTRVRLMVILRS